jgi:hypothetical protein
MGWFPIGPDFVFAPRDPAFKPLSRLNEKGRQGLVSSIAIEPGDARTIYVVVRPMHGGSSMFRTRDGGESWVAISDGLRARSANADPNWVAIHPVHPEIIYVGSQLDKAVHVSNNRGAPGSWTGPHVVGGKVLKLIVDPRGASDPHNTVVYATVTVINPGLYRSPDGGVTWIKILAAEPTSFVAHMPLTGDAHFYLGDRFNGLWHATDPEGTWENLCERHPELPRPGSFDSPLVDFCPRLPGRVYTCFATRDSTGRHITELYTTDSTTGWERVESTNIPKPDRFPYCYEFAVAPNSPGDLDGSRDILLFGNIDVNRSIDGGKNWTTQLPANRFHEDVQSFAFYPAVPGDNVVPNTYLGCDGGLASSLTLADPQVDELKDWNNLNHGKASTAIMAYACDPSIPAVSYIGCQDTGLAVGEKTLGWRGLADADVPVVAAARGAQGISCWFGWEVHGTWLSPRLKRVIDRRTDAPPVPQDVSFGGVPGVKTTADLVVGLDGKMITGMAVRDGSRTVAAAIPSGDQTVTPSTMTGIGMGTRVVVEPGVAGQEEVVRVTAFTGATFNANFVRAHPAGSALRLERAFVGRVGEDDQAQQISQEFGDKGGVVLVAIDFTNANVLYCSTNDGRVWTTNAATTAGPNTVWTEIANDRPGSSTKLKSISVDHSGAAYVLLETPVSNSRGVITPLYRLSYGTWVAEPVTNTPPVWDKFVADPVRCNVFYAISGNSVWRLEKTSWVFTDISFGLPKTPVKDLWIGNIGTSASPKVLLRAAVNPRGVFESNVTGDPDPSIALYLRAHLLDQGWLSPPPEGMPNPYNPNETLRHNMCPDIKVDTRTEGFFQTDLEGASPISHVHFDMLKDHSQNLRAGTAAKVHIMVHNRSFIPATNVQVWAIYCRSSAGVPGLNISPSWSIPNAFPFWNQFRISGLIEPGLPSDSPWRSIGPPVTLPEIDVNRPRVATFDWTVPSLTIANTEDYCMLVFVHSTGGGLIHKDFAPLNDAQKWRVDLITALSRQIGQKNLRVIA